jgi:Trypsin-like peptidase domain
MFASKKNDCKKLRKAIPIRELEAGLAKFASKQTLVIWLLASVLWIPFDCSATFASDADESLRIYAVNIHRTPMQTWGPGYGIYLGKGLFITAAHVAGHTWLTRPKVSIAGQEFPTNVVKAGDFETIDLTLLSVDENRLPLRLSLRRNPLCQEPPWAGERVITVVPEGLARSQILSPKLLPLGSRKFDTVIRDVATTGNSGSGVFDADKKCLLGIMSRKISLQITRKATGKTETVDIAKYFVPASVIANFIPAEWR